MTQKSDNGLRPIIVKHLKNIHWQPIETWGIAAGVPDLNGCGLSKSNVTVDFWIEAKSTSAFKVKFEPEQVAWIYRRRRYGGKVWIAVRRAHSGGKLLGAPVDELWLASGEIALQLVDHGLRLPREVFAGIWHGGPNRWDWDSVYDILLNG